jgi:TonB family protein
MTALRDAGAQIAAMRQFAFTQIGSRLTSEPNLVAAFWEEIGAPVNPSHPDLTVLYCSLQRLGQTFLLLEFVAGETLEELVKRSDPASCEREIPLFCRLLDAFESAERNGGSQTASQSDIELADFGVGRAKTWTTPTAHGAILVGPDGAVSEQVFGESGASRSQVCALLMELCARLPGNVPRSSAYGSASLGECATRSLAPKVLRGKPAPLTAASQVTRSLLVRTVASPYVIAVATAVLTLSGLYSVGGLLAKRSATANSGKLLFPPAPAPALEPPIETPAEALMPRPSVSTVRRAAKKPTGRQPIPSIVLARGARPIRQTSLEYPAEARKERITGTVEMQVTIAEDGSVQSPRMVSGDPLLQAGLAEEISKWVYQPMRVNGKPVPMTTELAIRFNLNP